MPPIDYSTDVGKVRALIPDVEQVDYNDDGTATYLFEDAHLTALLDNHAGRVGAVFRAAADAVDALATSEAYISKVIRTEDLQTDGAKVANALILRAQQLRRQADQAEEEDAGSAFDIVPFQPRPRIFWPR